MSTLPRRRTLFALIVLLILIVFNIAVSVFLIFTVNSVSFPTIDMRVNTITLTTDEALISYNLSINNQNDFDLTLQHLALIVSAQATELTRIPLQGGTVPAHHRLTLTDEPVLHLNATPAGPLIVTLAGDIDIAFLVIHKTLPLTLSVLASIKDLIDQIKMPTVLIEPSFGEITNTSIALNATITITNPNAFALILQNTTLTMNTDTNDSVAILDVPGGTIPANGDAAFHCTGLVRFAALNAKRLTLTLTAAVGATIANATKTIPLITTIAIAIPNLDAFFPHTHPVELRLWVDLHRVHGGIQGEVNLTVINPTSIPLYIRDLRIDYYTTTLTNFTYLASGNLTEHELTPHDTTIFTGTIFFPWSMVLPHGRPLIPPPRLYAALNANITLTGVTEHALWVRLGSFVDLRPFKLMG